MAILSKNTTIGGKIPLTYTTLSGDINLYDIRTPGVYTFKDITSISGFPDDYTVENIDASTVTFTVLNSGVNSIVQILIIELDTFVRQSIGIAWTYWNKCNSAIIDVNELPISNIDENIIYRVPSARFFNGHMSIYTTKCHCVDELPINEKAEHVWTSDCTVYYKVNTNSAHVFINSENANDDLSEGWHDLDEFLNIAFSGSFGGVITHLSEITDESNFYILINYENYQYKDKWIKLNNSEVNNTHSDTFNDVLNISSGNYSHAEGCVTKALANSAHAEGEQTEASGNYSHAEGNGTKANGTASHAEGSNNTADGYAAHAEGYNTFASTYSHAEGLASKAEGENSHAEGNSVVASGTNSHAEGFGTKSKGESSHAEGINTKANGKGSHVEGNFVEAHGNYSHAEGNSNGKSYGGDDYSPESIQTAFMTTPFSMAYGQGSHVEGQTNLAIGNGAHAEGLQNIASGDGSHAEGRRTIASGTYQHVQGKYNQYEDENGNPLNLAHIVGGGTSINDRKNIHTVDWEGNAMFAGALSATDFIVNEEYSLTEVVDYVVTEIDSIKNSDNNDILHVNNELVVGNVEKHLLPAVNITKTLQQGDNHWSDILSDGIMYVAVNDADKELISTIKTFKYSVGEVYGGHSGISDVTDTSYTIADVQNDIDNISNPAYAPVVDFIDKIDLAAIENLDSNSSIYSVTIARDVPLMFFSIYYETYNGVKLTSNGEATIMTDNVEYNIVTDKNNIGKKTTDNGEIFNDYTNNVAGSYSHAEGYRTNAANEYAHAEGYETIAQGIRSHAEGSASNAIGEASHAEGRKTKAVGKYAHSEGLLVEAYGNYSHAEGDSNNTTYTNTDYSESTIINTFNTKPFSMAYGQGSHVEGQTNLAIGQASHAEGAANIAKTNYSHVEGTRNISSANNQHVQGKYNQYEDENGNPLNLAHIVGGGSSAKNRKNIHTIDWKGNAYFAGDSEVSSVTLRSSTPGSNKKFRLTVNDDGLISVNEI